MRASRLTTAVTVLVLVAGAACGGGGTKTAATTTTTTTSTTASRGAAMQAFRDCMAAHGVQLPARQPRTSTSTTAGGAPPTSDGGRRGGGFSTPPPGVDPATFQAAMQACASTLPAGGFGGGNGNNAQFRSAFVAYVTCLKNHGVQTGDPSQGRQALANVDRTTPAFKAADQACRSLLPAPTTSTTAA
ncbi:MAG TPA: hypothetical protein VFA94_02175 [Acidimicrobiales bacterium]|nr:hypothetical protein [Acidimicrobiales bacterium]